MEMMQVYDVSSTKAVSTVDTALQHGSWSTYSDLTDAIMNLPRSPTKKLTQRTSSTSSTGKSNPGFAQAGSRRVMLRRLGTPVTTAVMLANNNGITTTPAAAMADILEHSAMYSYADDATVSVVRPSAAAVQALGVDDTASSSPNVAAVSTSTDAAAATTSKWMEATVPKTSVDDVAVSGVVDTAADELLGMAALFSFDATDDDAATVAQTVASPATTDTTGTTVVMSTDVARTRPVASTAPVVTLPTDHWFDVLSSMIRANDLTRLRIIFERVPQAAFVRPIAISTSSTSTTTTTAAAAGAGTVATTATAATVAPTTADDVEEPNWTLLMTAALKSNPEAVELILQAAERACQLSTRTFPQTIAVEDAVAVMPPLNEMFPPMTLIDYVSMYSHPTTGVTALQLALHASPISLQVVRMLLTTGGTPWDVIRSTAVGAPMKGLTTMHLGALSKHRGVLRVLAHLPAGAELPYCSVCLDRVATYVPDCCGAAACVTCLAEHCVNACKAGKTYSTMACLAYPACKVPVPVHIVGAILAGRHSSLLQQLELRSLQVAVQSMPDFVSCAFCHMSVAGGFLGPDVVVTSHGPASTSTAATATSGTTAAITETSGAASTSRVGSALRTAAAALAYLTGSTSTTTTTAATSTAHVAAPPRVGCPDCRTCICFGCGRVHPLHISCDEYKRSQITASEDFVATNCKPCPRCKSPIEKSSGCSHVVCTRCQFHMCYVCGGPYYSGFHVFGNPTSCPCEGLRLQGMIPVTPLDPPAPTTATTAARR